jgi:DNA-binding NarL/FixJ family response regulator
MPTTLLIADEFEVVRAGLKSMLAGSGIKVVAEASTGKEAVRLTLKHKPDVAMLGVRMPDGDGLNSLGRIKLDQPEQNVLMFSSFDNPTHIARAVAIGANGWISKTATHEQLLAAIRTAATGESTWTREELRSMSGALATPRLSSDDVEVSLTEREGEVLRQMAIGLTNREIAQTLHISYETVKEHVQHILRKVGVSDRTQAAVWAIRKGLA